MGYQMQLPFKVVKKKRPLTAGVHVEELQERIRKQEAELNRLRFYEFQYYHVLHAKNLTQQRLETLRHEYIEYQTRFGEYRGIFY